MHIINIVILFSALWTLAGISAGALVLCLLFPTLFGRDKETKEWPTIDPKLIATCILGATLFSLIALHFRVSPISSLMIFVATLVTSGIVLIVRFLYVAVEGDVSDEDVTTETEREEQAIAQKGCGMSVTPKECGH